jgi:hypothetical protein
MRYLAAVAAFVAFPAFAATVTWTNPTSYSDGSALAPADIASTTIEYSNGTTFGTVAGQVVVTGSVTTATAPDPAAGTSRCYRAKTTVIAAKGGQTSDPSNVSCKAVPFPKPNAPTILDVILAWLRGIWGRFA